MTVHLKSFPHNVYQWPDENLAQGFIVRFDVVDQAEVTGTLPRNKSAEYISKGQLFNGHERKLREW